MNNADNFGFPPFVQVKSDEVDQGRVYALIRLGSIQFDDKIKDFRSAKAYAPKDLDELKKSIVADGHINLLNPLHTTLDVDVGVVRTLGGNRRLASLLILLEKDNEGKSYLSADTLVPVYVYRTTDRKEALRRAMTDNAFRRDFNDHERLVAFEEMDRQQMTVQEIASASNSSTDTINRFLLIAKHSTLRNFLKDGILPYSKLSQLGSSIEKSEPTGNSVKVSGYITDLLLDWEAKAKAEKQAYISQCKRNGKKTSAAKMKLSAYLPGPLWTSWIEALVDGRMPDGKTTEKKLNFSMQGNSLVIDGIKRDLTTAPVDQLADDLIALRQAAKIVNSALARVMAGETKADNFRDSQEYREEMKNLTGSYPTYPVPPEADAAPDDDGYEDDAFDDEGDVVDEGASDGGQEQ